MSLFNWVLGSISPAKPTHQNVTSLIQFFHNKKLKLSVPFDHVLVIEDESRGVCWTISLEIVFFPHVRTHKTAFNVVKTSIENELVQPCQLADFCNWCVAEYNISSMASEDNQTVIIAQPQKSTQSDLQLCWQIRPYEEKSTTIDVAIVPLDKPLKIHVDFVPFPYDTELAKRAQRQQQKLEQERLRQQEAEAVQTRRKQEDEEREREHEQRQNMLVIPHFPILSSLPMPIPTLHHASSSPQLVKRGTYSKFMSRCAILPFRGGSSFSPSSMSPPTPPSS